MGEDYPEIRSMPPEDPELIKPPPHGIPGIEELAQTGAETLSEAEIDMLGALAGAMGGGGGGPKE